MQVNFQEALKGIELPPGELGKLPIPRTLSTSSKMPIGKPRTAHNLIEKKYRLSINEKINELRLMVAPDDEGSRKVNMLSLAIYLFSFVFSSRRLVYLRRLLNTYVTSR